MGEVVYLRDEAGCVQTMRLPLHPSIAQRVRQGQIVRVNADGSAYTPSATSDDATVPVPGPPAVRPAQAAPKKEWIAWAVAQGMPIADAEGLSKSELIDLYGRDPDPPASDPDDTTPDGPERGTDG